MEGGGECTLANLQTLCSYCHKLKTRKERQTATATTTPEKRKKGTKGRTETNSDSKVKSATLTKDANRKTATHQVGKRAVQKSAYFSI